MQKTQLTEIHYSIHDDKLLNRIHRELYQLLENGVAMSEYEIIRSFMRAGILHEDRNLFHDNYKLFKVHFIIFNRLYTLRYELLGTGHACLEIGPIVCRLMDYQKGEFAITQYDEVAAFYLDKSNFNAFSAQELDNMVGDFYEFLNNKRHRKNSLHILQLIDPVSDLEIRGQYRKLVMLHHPDRGGDVEHFKKINIAYRMLVN